MTVRVRPAAFTEAKGCVNGLSGAKDLVALATATGTHDVSVVYACFFDSEFAGFFAVGAVHAYSLSCVQVNLTMFGKSPRSSTVI